MRTVVKSRALLAGSSVVAAACWAAWAFGQGADHLQQCLGVGKLGADVLIRECTAAVQSGGHALPMIYLTRAAAYVLKGDYERALADYDEAIKLAPHTALAFAQRGEVHAKRRDYDSAIADYERAIELEPNLASAFSNRGLAWASKGEIRLAIADYTKAINLDPNLPVAFNNRRLGLAPCGMRDAARGEPEAAIADYGEAIRL